MIGLGATRFSKEVGFHDVREMSGEHCGGAQSGMEGGCPSGQPKERPLPCFSAPLHKKGGGAAATTGSLALNFKPCKLSFKWGGVGCPHCVGKSRGGAQSRAADGFAEVRKQPEESGQDAEPISTPFGGFTVSGP